MAAGDFTWFTQAKVDLGNKIHNLGSGGDTIKLGLITSAVTPTETDAAPHWGGTGTTNFATNQVTPGGNYATGGPTIAGQTFVAASPNAKFDFNDIAIAQHASNPNNARWGILYNSTDANKRAIGFLDLGSVRDLTGGDFSFAPHANGLVTLS
jgi:hypothetical protein